MKRALFLRDRGCRFPGCTNRMVDGHHIVPWSEGGPTRLANLVSLCRRHHRFVHENGVRIDVALTNDVTFVAPDGLELRRVATPPEPEAHRELLLRRAHAEARLEIDARTGHPRDTGPVDYGLAVQVLLERNARPIAAAPSEWSS